MGKRTQNAALQVLVTKSESVLWTGVLMQTALFAEGPFTLKVRALLTENAVVWCSLRALRELDDPIRVEYRQMFEPQVFLTGIVGRFEFSVVSEDDNPHVGAEHQTQVAAVMFSGIPASFIDSLVGRVPNLRLQSPVLQQRYR